MTRNLFILTCVVLLNACAGSSMAPVEDESFESPKTRVHSRGASSSAKTTASRKTKPSAGQHVVKSGDTLYSIAFAAGYDYRKIARWNDIGAPYTIIPGDIIRLMPPPQKSAAKSKREKKSANKSASGKTRPTPAPKTTRTLPNVPVKRWIWPVQGRLVSQYSPKNGNKGLKIAGKRGTPIRAAASGKIVYAGSGLKGYGNLVIIKHNDVYLSAYAHNRRLLVREGSLVRQGQKIGEMGNSGTNKVMLHFEIRRNGTPVNPIRYLPKKT